MGWGSKKKTLEDAVEDFVKECGTTYFDIRTMADYIKLPPEKTDENVELTDEDFTNLTKLFENLKAIDLLHSQQQMDAEKQHGDLVNKGKKCIKQLTELINMIADKKIRLIGNYYELFQVAFSADNVSEMRLESNVKTKFLKKLKEDAGEDVKKTFLEKLKKEDDKTKLCIKKLIAVIELIPEPEQVPIWIKKENLVNIRNEEARLKRKKIEAKEEEDKDYGDVEEDVNYLGNLGIGGRKRRKAKKSKKARKSKKGRKSKKSKKSKKGKKSKKARKSRKSKKARKSRKRKRRR